MPNLDNKIARKERKKNKLLNIIHFSKTFVDGLIIKIITTFSIMCQTVFWNNVIVFNGTF